MTQAEIKGFFAHFADPNLEDAFQTSIWDQQVTLCRWVFGIAAGGMALSAVSPLIGLEAARSFPLLAIAILNVISCLLPFLFLKSPDQQGALDWAVFAAHLNLFAFQAVSLVSSARPAAGIFGATIAVSALFTLAIPSRPARAVSANIFGGIAIMASLYIWDYLTPAELIDAAILLVLWNALCITLMRRGFVRDREGFASQHELQQSLDASQTILNASSAFSELISIDGTRLACSDQVPPRLGQPLEKLIGAKVYESYPPETYDAWRKNFKKVISSRRFHEAEVQNAGHVYHIDYHPVFGTDGTVRQVVSTSWDVTNERHREAELQALMEEAQAANQAKSAFLANMSHELRTPLNAILGFSEFLAHVLTKISGTEKAQEYVAHVREGGAHLLALVNDVLDLSKIEAGHYELDETTFDLNDLIESVSTTMETQASVKHLTIDRHLPHSHLYLHADSRAITQVLLNLLSNAIKFTEDNRRIWIGAARAGRGLQITVGDTGIGMTEEEITSALTLFGRAERPEVRTTEGSGLGLPLAQDLVRLHGGKISIESFPTHGTTVFITLPGNRIADSLDTLSA